MPFDVDLTDPEDLTLIVAAVDDEPAGDGSGMPGPPPGPRPRSGCAGCGCAGCLTLALVIAAATSAAGAMFVAMPLALGALVLAVAGRLVDGAHRIGDEER